MEETGQGLPEYIEQLGKTEGIAAVIEYLNRLKIRFYDGSGGSPLSKSFRVQPHDPFQPDVRPDWMIPTGESSPDLKSAIYDFTNRHENSHLRKHAERGNINGVENFLDIFTVMVRLLYVYFRRGVVEKQQFIGRVCRYVEIATGSFEDSGYVYPGYLSSMSENLQGGKSLMLKVCQETNFAGFLWAAFLAVQMVRYDPDEASAYDPKPNRPTDCLPIASKALKDSFSATGVPMPTREEVLKALEHYKMISREECELWAQELDGNKSRPSTAHISAEREAALMGHHRMQELFKVTRFKMQRYAAPQADCVSWIRRDLENNGIKWNEWLWMLSEYGHDRDVMARVDRVVRTITGNV